MFSFNLSASIGTSLRRSVIARVVLCVYRQRSRVADEAVSRNSWAHYPLSRALCIKHRAHNRGYDLARDRDPLLVRENHPCSPWFATLDGPEIDFHNVLADSGAVGRYSPVFTVERACSPLGCFLLLAFPALARLLSIVHTALPPDDNC